MKVPVAGGGGALDGAGSTRGQYIEERWAGAEVLDFSEIRQQHERTVRELTRFHPDVGISLPPFPLFNEGPESTSLG